MKRKLALVMSAIMTVAMVPTTAFAATKVTAVDEITTGVDKIFTSRVELKNDNDQSDIVTSDGTFVVRATLTNGKFARVNDDDDNDYEMDSIHGDADNEAGTATYDWEKTGIVAVDVLSDTTANVTLKASVFNQSDDSYTEDWVANWITNNKTTWLAANPDGVETYWKSTYDADATAQSAAESAWKSTYTADATAQSAAESAWESTYDADATAQSAAESAWESTYTADATAQSVAESEWKSAYTADATAQSAAESAWKSAYTGGGTADDAWTALTATEKEEVYDEAGWAALTVEEKEAVYDEAGWAALTVEEKEAVYDEAGWVALTADELKAATDAALEAAAKEAYTDAYPSADGYAKSCVLPIIAKTVDAGDVVVKFTSNISGFKSASEVIAKAVDGGDADITVEGVRTFVEDGDEEDTVKEITINELTPDTLEGNKIELKLKGNWEYVKHDPTISFLNQSLAKGTDYSIDVDDDIITITFTPTGAAKLKNDKMLTKMTISGIQLETTKKCDSGDVATITVSSKDFDSVKLEVAKMVEEAVTYSVEDKKLPTIWAGKNYAIDDDANTLKLSVEENAGDILNTSRKATFTFPEGIEVVGITDTKGLTSTGTYKFRYEIDENVVTIYNYQKGTSEGNKVDMDLKFILNAAPSFSGDVTVTLGGQFDDTSFKVATVKAPYTVEAKTSEVLIDYRYVPVNDIVITEAEDGILKEDDKIVLAVEKMDFEDAGDVKVTDGDIDVDVDVDSKGGVYLYDNKSDADYLVVTVKDESTEASTIVISGLELYLDRTLPVGGYALQNIGGTFGKHDSYDKDDAMSTDFSEDAINVLWENSMDEKDIYDYTPNDDNKSNGIFKYKTVTANDEYVNVITAARDQDDSMTSKKIIITVGAATMTAGTDTVTLDAPAYINSANYTMLPLRAISEAFGATVNWDNATRTVTILKGQRIISMTIGSRTMYVNGTPVAMNTAPEISKDRSFVPIRDLANAFGISNINWTEASGTVTLN